jgi:hypothetical protein
MVEITRHTGRLSTTGQRCVVVFREVPEDQNYALIVQTDQLPDMFHDNLMHVIQEPVAQQEHDLSKVLYRRRFANGEPMLQALHERGFLRKEPVDNVVLYPMPNRPLSLREANEEIEKMEGKYVPENEVAKPDASTVPSEDVVSAGGTASTDASEDDSATAATLLFQAELLEKDAQGFREKAYTLDPSLRPSKGRPKISDAEKARRKQQHNKKRTAKKASKNKSEE